MTTPLAGATIVFDRFDDGEQPPPEPFYDVVVNGVKRGYFGWQDEAFNSATGRRTRDAGWKVTLAYGPNGRLLDTCLVAHVGSQRGAEGAILRMLEGTWK